MYGVYYGSYVSDGRDRKSFHRSSLYSRNEEVERKFNGLSSTSDRMDTEQKTLGFRLLFRSSNVFFSYEMDVIADSGKINSNKYKKKHGKICIQTTNS